MAGPALAVEQVPFMVGERRPVGAAAAAIFGSHFNSILVAPSREIAGRWNCSETCGGCSREPRARFRRGGPRVAKKAAYPAHLRTRRRSGMARTDAPPPPRPPHQQ